MRSPCQGSRGGRRHGFLSAVHGTMTPCCLPHAFPEHSGTAPPSNCCGCSWGRTASSRTASPLFQPARTAPVKDQVTRATSARSYGCADALKRSSRRNADARVVRFVCHPRRPWTTGATPAAPQPMTVIASDARAVPRSASSGRRNSSWSLAAPHAEAKPVALMPRATSCQAAWPRCAALSWCSDGREGVRGGGRLSCAPARASRGALRGRAARQIEGGRPGSRWELSVARLLRRVPSGAGCRRRRTTARSRCSVRAWW